MVESLGNIINEYDDIPTYNFVKIATKLIINGDIKLLQYDEEEDTDKTLNLVKSEIENIFNQENYDFLYKLTPKGGAKWESFTHPNWDIFLSKILFYDGSGLEKLEFMSRYKHTLESKLAFDALTRNLQHLPGSEVWEVLEPWKPTYWKTLPRGYRVTAQSGSNVYPLWKEIGSIEWIDLNYMESEKELSQSKYYKFISSAWYNEPDFD